MALRCFLFSEDENTASLVRQILESLGVEAESCSDAVAAAETITNQPFQIVIIDWDKQPEAAVMLNTARERKAVERPLTLVIVNDDKTVASVLQAGANSILRKPIVLNQATDTLTMARDLIRAKQDPAPSAGHAVVAAASASSKAEPPSNESGGTLRHGEFLQSAPAAPGGQFETDADVEPAAELGPAEPVRPLKDLEPVATSVAEEEPKLAPPQPESRGLEWYKNRLASLQPKPEPTLPPSPTPKPSGKPDLLGYDQTPSSSSASDSADSYGGPATAPRSRPASRDSRKDEAALFAYIDGGGSESENSSGPRFRLGKRTIIGALILAVFAVAAAPQAPWHPKLRSLWSSGRQSMRAWLNPQPVTLVQAPAAHEDFARAGDEYKLPVAEPIPDATTDPSQIQVVPVIDPTVKKPNSDTSGEQSAGQSVASATPGDSSAAPANEPTVQVAEQPAPNLPAGQPAAGPPAVVPVSSPPPTVVVPSETTRPEVPKAIASPVVSTPASKPSPQPRQPYVPGNVPSSLKSQLAPSGDAGGNKPVDAALPSIEPVQLAEAAERALLAESPAIAYPENAKGQQGTVTLQVLVGRDGSVQDAKFIQGSLAFARNAIEGVKQWRFKPYLMNGRAVSVQTQLTMRFSPAQ